jgi:hypothetical protein
MTALLQQIASVAHGLTKAELQVLLQLAARADQDGGLVALASSRELAETTGLARASVQVAIDSLNEKRLLTSSAGSAMQPAGHRLDCLEVVKPEVSGPTAEPPVAQILGQGGLTIGPGVAQILSQGGPTVEPGVAQNLGHRGLEIRPPSDGKTSTCESALKERAYPRADSIDFKIEKTIDRLQKATRGDFDEAVFELARNQIASHHAKFARKENRQPNLPDDQITAQFLAVAEWPKLEAMLMDLTSERKEAGHSHGWYVTVALQRIHGISPQQLREARNRRNAKPCPADRSSVVPFGNRSGDVELASANSAERVAANFRRPPEVQQLMQQINSFARAKSL